MKVAFLYNSALFNSLFLSLAYFFRALGHTPVLINARIDIAHLWKRHSFDILEIKDDLDDNIKNIDIVVTWNGLTFQRKLLDIFEANSVDVWYMENGYFSNSLQCNKKGVNAKADFASLSWREQIKFEYPESVNLPKCDIKIIKSSLYDLSIYVLLKLIDQPSFLFYKAFANIKKYLNKFKSLYYKLRFNDGKLHNYILVILQVNNDTQILKNSHFKDMYHFLDTVLPLLESCNLPIVLKEHPSEQSWVNYSKYKKGTSQIEIILETNLKRLIERSAVVVTVNSSVGMQAISHGKKVCVFGDAFYANFPNVLNCASDNIDLSCENIQKFIQGNFVNKEDIERYTLHFVEKIFIKGDWRKPDKHLIKNLAKRILA